jgi:branched-chain amino acid transport system ATP-binding protein
MTGEILSVRGLIAGYGRIQVLKQVDLDIRAGEIVAVIGANGAGKSTLLRAISGLIRPTGGEIRLMGRDVTGLPAEELVALGLVHIPERRQLFTTMTVEENLGLGAYARRRTASRREIEADRDRIYAMFPILAQRRRQQAGTLSGGEQQMLAVGRALMARPKLLLLDEPSLGLAPLAAQQIFEAVAELRKLETAVLLVEQNAHQALRLADRGYVMEAGRFPLSGTAEELRNNPTVQQIYLGIG